MSTWSVVRRMLVLCVLTVLGCAAFRSPVLNKDEAIRILMTDGTFRGLEKCEGDGRNSMFLRRTVIDVRGLERKADSEADCCYVAEVEWQWRAESGEACLPGALPFRSYAEFRFGNRWRFFSLYGEGVEGSIEKYDP